MDVIYCYGQAGTGKTTYAKEFAKMQNLDYFVSGSSNDAFDGYMGEPVIILDDLRGSAFAFSDLLKILDNNTRSPVKSRYYNKVVCCKYIIITSIMPIEKLYSMFDKEEYQEPVEQLKRRCKDVLRFEDDKIYIYHWNDVKRIYETIGTIPNVYKFKHKVEAVDSKEEKIKLVSKLFGDMGDSFKEVSEYITNNTDVIMDDFEQISIDADGYMSVPEEYDIPFDSK